MRRLRTPGSFLIRRQRGHPVVGLPLVIYHSANHSEGMQLSSSQIRQTSPIRNEPNWNHVQLPITNTNIYLITTTVINTSVF